MRLGRLSLNFRTKLVLLAVVLVTAIQLATVIPVLKELRQRQLAEADERVRQAGVLYDEYIDNRRQQLTLSIDALVRDPAFRQAVAAADRRAIGTALRDRLQPALQRFRLAVAVRGPDGNFVAGAGAGPGLFPAAIADGESLDLAGMEEPDSSIAYVGGKPFHAVTAIVEMAGVALASVTIAAPLDQDFAAEISRLLRLETTIVGFGDSGASVYATTLDGSSRSAALASLNPDSGSGAAPDRTAGWITHLRPYLDAGDGVYVALQLPMMDVDAAYAEIRNSVAALAVIALLVTVIAAVGLSRMVTQPIGRLVAASRRLAEGVYDQAIPVKSHDEFAVLAQGFNAMQEAIASRERHIVHMAHHDSLSGLPMREIVVSEMRAVIATSEQTAIVNFVLHRFDELASSLGHRTADRLIQLVAGRMRDLLGEGQFVGHLSRQEFVVVLPEADLGDAQRYLSEIENLLRSGLAVDGANISLQIRAGIALYPNHGLNASALLRCAAIARGHGSRHQGGFGVYRSGQEDESLELIRIVGDFPRALRNGELWVEYQPKLDCHTGELVGAEALVRWQHPRLGRLAPDVFIDAIEQAGSISQLTRWVLEQAITSLAAWRSQGLLISMSVNISVDDLIDDRLPGFLDGLCARHDTAAELLTLELTESAIMHDVDNSLAVLEALRRRGFRIAIDDFGTGHSALAQLKRLPVDELKIDKSFVLNIADRRDEAVVRTAVELAHQFGLTAVAEGVEDETARIRLQQLGCELVQGFLFSRALPDQDFVAWARAWAGGAGADMLSLVEAHEAPRRARR